MTFLELYCKKKKVVLKCSICGRIKCPFMRNNDIKIKYAREFFPFKKSLVCNECLKFGVFNTISKSNWTEYLKNVKESNKVEVSKIKYFEDMYGDKFKLGF